MASGAVGPAAEPVSRTSIRPARAAPQGSTMAISCAFSEGMLLITYSTTLIAIAVASTWSTSVARVKIQAARTSASATRATPARCRRATSRS